MSSLDRYFWDATFSGVVAFGFLLAACGEKSGTPPATDEGSNAATSVREEVSGRVPLSAADDINVDVIAVQYRTYWKFLGTVGFNIGTGRPRYPDPETEDFIVVVREESEENGQVPQGADLKRGVAYQWLGKSDFHKIRNVDLALSDDEIAAQFGVGNPSNERLLTDLLKDREIDLEAAKRLLKVVRNVNYRGPSGRGIIHQAALGGHLEIVKALIEKGANPNLPGMNESNPLGSAAAGGNPEIVEYLLSVGAEVNLVDIYGESALHASMYGRGCVECAKILITHGANRTLKSKEGKTPLELAKDQKGTMKNYDEMIAYMSSLDD